MDYPIQPISVLELQGRTAALAWLSDCGEQQPANPYAAETDHGRWWGIGFTCALIERAESPFLLMPDGRVEFVRGGQA
jgi:hypothetical protein